MIGKYYIAWTPCRKWAGLSDNSDSNKWLPIVYIHDAVSSLKQKKISQPHCGDIRHRPWDAQLGVGWGQEKVVDARQLQRFWPLSHHSDVCVCVLCVLCVLCVCVCEYLHASTHAHMQVHVNVKGRGQRLLSSLIPLCLKFWEGVFHWTWSLLIQVD